MLTGCYVDVASRARDVAGGLLATPTPSRPQAGSLPFPAAIAAAAEGSDGFAVRRVWGRSRPPRAIGFNRPGEGPGRRWRGEPRSCSRPQLGYRPDCCKNML
jgi:hypothetical protein